MTDKDRVHFTDLPPKLRARYLASPDVLDAWVQKRITRAKVAFEEKTSIRQRLNYVRLPVAIETPAGAREVEQPAPSDFRQLFERERRMVAICGPGGSGKSTLAVRIARWAMSEEPNERLLKHMMIPVWIEAETTDLLADVSSELREMTGVEDIESEVVSALLYHKRILVTVDALSERTRATHKYVCGIYGTETPINALLVTSRTHLGICGRSLVHPRLIDERTVVLFMQQYLNSLDELSDKVRETMRGRQQLQISERALAIVERRGERVPVTPLFVRMFVESAIERIDHEGSFDPGKLATSVPQTILDYLKWINPDNPDTPDRVDGQQMLHTARVLGRAMLEPDFLPKTLRGDAAKVALVNAKVANPVSVLRRLIANGVIEEGYPGGTLRHRFAFDPIAEYLAAIDWTDSNGSDATVWESLLNRLEQGDGMTAHGFAVALYDAVSTYDVEFHVPIWVRPRLEVLSTAIGIAA